MSDDERLKDYVSRAIPPMPEQCLERYMSAVRSVKEDEPPVKRKMTQLIPIVAAVMILMTSTAFATQKLSLLSVLGPLAHDDRRTPASAAQDAEPIRWEVGPMTFTMEEAIADEHIFYRTVRVRMSDGSKAVILPAGKGRNDPIRTVTGLWNGDLPAETTFVQAAQKLGRPLYCVTVMEFYDMDSQYSTGSCRWDEECCAFFTQGKFRRPQEDAYASELYIGVTELDENGSRIEGRSWHTTVTLETPIHGVYLSRSYAPEDPQAFPTATGTMTIDQMDIAISGITAYVTLYVQDYRVTDWNTAEDFVNIQPILTDGDGRTFERSAVYQSSSIEWSRPDVKLTYTYSIAEAPQRLTLEDASGFLRSGPITFIPQE